MVEASGRVAGIMDDQVGPKLGRRQAGDAGNGVQVPLRHAPPLRDRRPAYPRRLGYPGDGAALVEDFGKDRIAFHDE